MSWKVWPCEFVGMICPRPLLIQMGVKDPVIPIEGARVENQRAALHYQKLGVSENYQFWSIQVVMNFT